MCCRGAGQVRHLSGIWCAVRGWIGPSDLAGFCCARWLAPLLRCGRVCWLWPACYAWRSHRVPSLTWRSSRRPTCATVRPAATAAASTGRCPATHASARCTAASPRTAQQRPVAVLCAAGLTHPRDNPKHDPQHEVCAVHPSGGSVRQFAPRSAFLHREPDRRGWLAGWMAGLLAGF
jgi:hypothetical protein